LLDLPADRLTEPIYLLPTIAELRRGWTSSGWPVKKHPRKSVDAPTWQIKVGAFFAVKRCASVRKL
jgi:hypothetical protein